MPVLYCTIKFYMCKKLPVVMLIYVNANITIDLSGYYVCGLLW